MGTRRIIGWGLFVFLLILSALLLPGRATAQGSNLTVTWNKLPSGWEGYECTKGKVCGWSLIVSAPSYVPIAHLSSGYPEATIDIYADPKAFGSLNEFGGSVTDSVVQMFFKGSTSTFNGYPAHKLVSDLGSRSIEGYRIDLGNTRAVIVVDITDTDQRRQDVANILKGLSFAIPSSQGSTPSRSYSPTPARTSTPTATRTVAAALPSTKPVTPGALVTQPPSGAGTPAVAITQPPVSKATGVVTPPPAQVTVKPAAPATSPPSSGTGKDATIAPPPGIGRAGQVPGPTSLPRRSPARCCPA